jgi:hypothetical protein
MSAGEMVVFTLLLEVLQVGKVERGARASWIAPEHKMYVVFIFGRRMVEKAKGIFLLQSWLYCRSYHLGASVSGT